MGPYDLLEKVIKVFEQLQNRDDRMKMKSSLVGWDDGNLYFYDQEKKEYCVNDHLELYEKMVKLCVEYFKQKKSGANTNQEG